MANPNDFSALPTDQSQQVPLDPRVADTPLPHPDAPPYPPQDTASQKRLLEEICEFLLDHNISLQFFEACVSQHLLDPNDLPPSLRRKQHLNAAILFTGALMQKEPTIEETEKLLNIILDLLQENPHNENLFALPSLIGFIGMTILFYQYVQKETQIQTLWDWLDILLPASSEIAYVKQSRAFCQEAIESLSATEIPQPADPTDFLMTIGCINVILSRYPIPTTLSHIKVHLEKTLASLQPSRVEAVMYSFFSDYCKPYVHFMSEPHELEEQHPKQRKRTDKTTQKAPKHPTVDEAGQVVKQKKRRFSEEETQNLIEGVKQFGVGHWKSILLNFKFDNRSCVDLKDKWRNLEFSKLRMKKVASIPNGKVD